MLNDYLQRFFSWFAGQPNRFGRLFQWEAVSDQWPHIQSARKHQPGDFLLDRKIGGITADKVFLIQANGSKIEVLMIDARGLMGVGIIPFSMRKKQYLAGAAYKLNGSGDGIIGWHGDDRR